MRSNIKKNYAYNAVLQLSNIFVPVITLPYISRILGAAGLGRYSFAYSVAYYFSIFIKLGLQNYGNRTIAYVKDDKDKLSRTFWEIYSFQFVLGIFISGAYFIYTLFFSSVKILAMIMSVVIFAAMLDVTWFMYGMEEFKVTAVRDIVTKVVTTILIFTLVKTDNDTWKYALIFVAGLLCNQLVVWPLVCKHVSFKRVAWNDISKHIKPNLILFIPVIAVSVYRTMDKIMLGAMTVEQELGYYHSCENVIRVPLALINALGIVMLPRMANMIALGEDDDSITRTFSKSIEFGMFITTAVGMGIMTVAVEFVPIFYGAGFEKCIWLFYIIIPSCLFTAFANVIRTQYLIPRKMDKIYIISLIAGAVINLLANLLLIPYFASAGAAIGTLAAEIVVCVVQAACVFKEADIRRNIINSLPFIFAGIVMFVVFYDYVPPINNSIIALLAKIVISGLLYLAVLGGIIIIKRTLVKKNT